jgi:DNA-binding CsgD family transcriptional regulator
LPSLIDRAIAACREIGDEARLLELYHLSCGALIDQDRLGAARAAARETIAAARTHENLWFEGAGELNLALIETLSGDYDAAISASKRAAAAYQASGNSDLEQNAMLAQALAWLLFGEYQRSQETYQSILVHQLERLEDAYYFQSVVRGMASIAAKTQQYELSARITGMAEAEYERTGIAARKPLLQAFAAFAATAEGMIGAEVYRTHLETGRALTKLEALTELLELAAPPTPVDRKARPAPFNLLSNREFEVLQHLRSGKTDPEIAAELYLSPRTVSQHVSSILGKLQVSSRTAAAALAASANIR